MTTLRATVRLQLNGAFDFAAAAAQVPYFAALGLSHIYMSPIAMARPGSTHGYDVINPMIVNPELGGEPGLDALVATLHAHDMGSILDIVPNHMAADLANIWWSDVLAQGEDSPYAVYFDIEWDAPEAVGRLWLPWLDVPLEQAVENRRCVIERHAGGVGIGLRLDDDTLPVSEHSLQWLFGRAGVELPSQAAPGTIFDAVRLRMQDALTQVPLDQAMAAVNADTGLLHQFLYRQHYRLGRWRDSGQQLNYRRFFDIHSLAALRMEHEDVFDAVHALPLRLIENGSIDGLRVDHIDGLSRPGHYLRRLRERMDQRSQRDLQRHVTLHVEKILAPGERLPADWPVDGTTGYDFMQQVGTLQHDPDGYAELCDAWATLSGRPADFAEEEHAARQYVLSTSLVAELSRCARNFLRYIKACCGTSETAAPSVSLEAFHNVLPSSQRKLEALYNGEGRSSSDFDVAEALDDRRPPLYSASSLRWDDEREDLGKPAAPDVLRNALHDVLVEMPVYRSYLGDDTITETDREVLDHAFAQAEKDDPSDDASLRAMLRNCLLLTDDAQPSTEQTRLLQASRYTFEQLSSALNAKAVEDTAFYRHGALLARNEVGSAPASTQDEPESFHLAMQERAQHWPHSLLATATHDHKRGEDTRARLSALGERAQTFIDDFNALSRLIGSRAQPFPFTLWVLLQTLLAAWPLGLRIDDRPGMQAFAQRIKAWLLKSEREAKLHTHWTAPDQDYETACETLVDDLLLSDEYAPLREELCDAARKLDTVGALNGLISATLHFTAPGVPDLYQGAEYWDQSLVDPDNRRAVDYRVRAETLQQSTDFRAQLQHYQNSTIKQHLIHRLLQRRKAHPELFANGSYRPVSVAGKQKQHVVAFVREHGDQQLFVAVPRLCADPMLHAGQPLVPADFWANTRVEAFCDDSSRTFVDVFTERKHAVHASGWRIDELLSDWPVAVLISNR